ncbi:MAG: hypothetical protein AAGI17_08505 [Planctomycetota bacterium]
MTTATQPIARVKLGAIQAAIWKNVSEKGTHYNATIERGYRDANGNPKSTGSFGTNDLLLAIKVMDLAHTRMMELHREDREAERAQQEAAANAGHQR